jgi:hypothetical protein
MSRKKYFVQYGGIWVKVFSKEADMPLGEIKKEDGAVDHLICEGSRRHVLHWDMKGEHCGEPKCEINKHFKQS